MHAAETSARVARRITALREKSLSSELDISLVVSVRDSVDEHGAFVAARDAVAREETSLRRATASRATDKTGVTHAMDISGCAMESADESSTRVWLSSDEFLARSQFS
jgi:hypothetical protein|tara:strand:- start:2791 stop:3114 length:324 start_codon:yes stop_codon:yes gene_type:complete